MIDAPRPRCECCEEKPATLRPDLDNRVLCPECAESFRKIEAAVSDLLRRLEPTVRLWARQWAYVGLETRALRWLAQEAGSKLEVKP